MPFERTEDGGVGKTILNSDIIGKNIFLPVHPQVEKFKGKVPPPESTPIY